MTMSAVYFIIYLRNVKDVSKKYTVSHASTTFANAISAFSGVCSAKL